MAHQRSPYATDRWYARFSRVSNEQVLAYFQQIKALRMSGVLAKDQRVRDLQNKIAEAHMHLVPYMARRWSKLGISFDDLEHYANEVLLRALDGFDEEKNRGGFTPYLCRVIEYRFIDEFRRRKRSCHYHYKAESLNPIGLIPGYDYDNDNDGCGDIPAHQARPEDELLARTPTSCLEAVLAFRGILNERERMVLQLFVHGYKQSEISRLINRTNGTVRWIKHRAMQKLKRNAEARAIFHDFLRADRQANSA